MWNKYKNTSASSELVANNAEATAEPDFATQWRRRNEQQPGDDDFATFIYSPPTKLGSTTALQWWSTPAQRSAYLALSTMAIDCLSAMPMSSDSERSFSRVRRTVDWQRSRLDGSSVEEAECSKDWQTSGLAYVPIDDHLAAIDLITSSDLLQTRPSSRRQGTTL